MYAKGYSTKKNYLLQIGSRTISERYSEYYGVQDDGKAQEFRAQMKVAQSRIELRRANLPSNGQRGELVERLETHRAVRTQTLSESPTDDTDCLAVVAKKLKTDHKTFKPVMITEAKDLLQAAVVDESFETNYDNTIIGNNLGVRTTLDAEETVSIRNRVEALEVKAKEAEDERLKMQSFVDDMRKFVNAQMTESRATRERFASVFR